MKNNKKLIWGVIILVVALALFYKYSFSIVSFNNIKCNFESQGLINCDLEPGTQNPKLISGGVQSSDYKIDFFVDNSITSQPWIYNFQQTIVPSITDPLISSFFSTNTLCKRQGTNYYYNMMDSVSCEGIVSANGELCPTAISNLEKWSNSILEVTRFGFEDCTGLYYFSPTHPYWAQNPEYAVYTFSVPKFIQNKFANQLFTVNAVLIQNSVSIPLVLEGRCNLKSEGTICSVELPKGLSGINYASDLQLQINSMKINLNYGGYTCTDGEPKSCSIGECPGTQTCVSGQFTECVKSNPQCGLNPTCSDGIMNGDETSIDCGGTCPKCEPPVPPTPYEVYLVIGAIALVILYSYQKFIKQRI